MVPKVDTINLSYFVPGIVVMFAVIVLVQALQPTFMQGIINANEWLTTSIFLGLSYIFGYGMWALGDILYRERSDKYIYDTMFMYICWEKPLRDRYIRLLVATGNRQMAFVIRRVTPAMIRRFREERRYACLRNPFRPFPKTFLNRIIYVYGRRLRQFIWDSIYTRNNPHHIGRFLSSWNNVKFAKATACSLFVAGTLFGMLFLFCLFCYCMCFFTQACTRYFAFWLITWTGAFIYWRCVVQWRLRVYCRDLVHGLA